MPKIENLLSVHRETHYRINSLATTLCHIKPFRSSIPSQILLRLKAFKYNHCTSMRRMQRSATNNYRKQSHFRLDSGLALSIKTRLATEQFLIYPSQLLILWLWWCQYCHCPVKIWAISSDIHQFKFIKLHHFK